MIRVPCLFLFCLVADSDGSVLLRIGSGPNTLFNLVEIEVSGMDGTPLSHGALTLDPFSSLYVAEKCFDGRLDTICNSRLENSDPPGPQLDIEYPAGSQIGQVIFFNRLDMNPCCNERLRIVNGIVRMEEDSVLKWDGTFKVPRDVYAFNIFPAGSVVLTVSASSEDLSLAELALYGLDGNVLEHRRAVFADDGAGVLSNLFDGDASTLAVPRSGLEHQPLHLEYADGTGVGRVVLTNRGGAGAVRLEVFGREAVWGTAGSSTVLWQGNFTGEAAEFSFDDVATTTSSRTFTSTSSTVSSSSSTTSSVSSSTSLTISSTSTSQPLSTSTSGTTSSTTASLTSSTWTLSTSSAAAGDVSSSVPSTSAVDSASSAPSASSSWAPGTVTSSASSGLMLSSTHWVQGTTAADVSSAAGASSIASSIQEISSAAAAVSTSATRSTPAESTEGLQSVTTTAHAWSGAGAREASSAAAVMSTSAMRGTSTVGLQSGTEAAAADDWSTTSVGGSSPTNVAGPTAITAHPSSQSTAASPFSMPGSSTWSAAEGSDALGEVDGLVVSSTGVAFRSSPEGAMPSAAATTTVASVVGALPAAGTGPAMAAFTAGVSRLERAALQWLEGTDVAVRRLPGLTLGAFSLVSASANALSVAGLDVALPRAVLGKAAALTVVVPDEGALAAVPNVHALVGLSFFDGTGAPVAVAGLEEPTRVTVPVAAPENVSSVQFWHEELGEWRGEGVSIVGRSTGALEFATAHNTLFALLLRGFLNTLLCANMGLLSLEALKGLTASGWYLESAALLFWLILLLLAATLGNGNCSLRVCMSRSPKKWEDC